MSCQRRMCLAALFQECLLAVSYPPHLTVGSVSLSLVSMMTGASRMMCVKVCPSAVPCKLWRTSQTPGNTSGYFKITAAAVVTSQCNQWAFLMAWLWPPLWMKMQIGSINIYIWPILRMSSMKYDTRGNKSVAYINGNLSISGSSNFILSKYKS